MTPYLVDKSQVSTQGQESRGGGWVFVEVFVGSVRGMLVATTEGPELGRRVCARAVTSMLKL